MTRCGGHRTHRKRGVFRWVLATQTAFSVLCDPNVNLGCDSGVMDRSRRDPRTYAIIGAALKVQRELPPGHLEAVYQGALAIQFEEDGLPFEREVPLPVYYHGKPVGAPYRADFLCYGEIIVEIKATGIIGRVEIAQVANYLAATRQPLGLILDFGRNDLGIQRVIGRHALARRHEWDTDPKSVLPEVMGLQAPGDSVSSVAPTSRGSQQPA